MGRQVDHNINITKFNKNKIIGVKDDEELLVRGINNILKYLKNGVVIT